MKEEITTQGGITHRDTTHGERYHTRREVPHTERDTHHGAQTPLYPPWSTDTSIPTLGDTHRCTHPGRYPPLYTPLIHPGMPIYLPNTPRDAHIPPNTPREGYTHLYTPREGYTHLREASMRLMTVTHREASMRLMTVTHPGRLVVYHTPQGG